MPLQTIKIADHVALEDLFSYCAQRRQAAPQYRQVCDRRVYDAYSAARKANLRFNRKTNVLRDDRLGVLSRPSNPGEWTEADLDEARDALMREVWCAAVTAFNREHMGAAS